MAANTGARSLEETPTWAFAAVCFVLVLISIIIERLIHLLGEWLKKKHKRAPYEALEKVKSELMLMGFISLLLTVLQGPISDICIPKSVAATWHPCDEDDEKKKYGNSTLPVKTVDKCASKGKVAFVSAYGIYQLHKFIFVLAVVHILYCIVTYALGKIKMRRWNAWEKETKSIEYQHFNDPERFRFARDTSFGRRHLNFWSKTPISLWIVCFFRQFFGSVTKVDYLTLRHGFIIAHLAPGSEATFDFQKYIKRSLEEDFKVVFGISPIIWFIAVLLLLSNTHGLQSYLWLPFIPFVITLLVGTKLQVIITKMGLRILDRGDVCKGAPVVKPGDDLFWFGRPRFLLFLIHLVLFQNAFQLAFFIWSTYEFSINSCFHKGKANIIIRISMGVIIQILCSYVTLPLYALVTQMGSTMRPTVFNERVAAALKNWHHTAKKRTKHSRYSEATTPLSSRPSTPPHHMSPAHLLQQNYPRSTENYQFHTSPRNFNFENGNWDLKVEDSPQDQQFEKRGAAQRPVQDGAGPSELSPAPQGTRTQHEIDMNNLSSFTFGRSD